MYEYSEVLEYQKLKEEMGQEKAEKTKLGEMRFEMFKSIARTMDILDLSSNAMAAVWSKVSYEQSENNKDKTEKWERLKVFICMPLV